MKIINEKGKLFGIINLVDLLVLLAVVAVALGLTWKFVGSGIASGGDTTTLTFTARVRAVQPWMEAEVKKSLELDNRVVAGTSFVEGATISGVTVEKYHAQVATDQGTLVDAEDPVRVDFIFTVRATVPKGGAILKVGPQEIRAGTGYFVKTKYLEFSANIESVILDG